MRTWIDSGIPSHFSRFGDGEWYAILGHRVTNIDGCRCDLLGLGDDLMAAAVFPPPRVTNALQGLVRGKKDLIGRIRRMVPGVDEWPDADLFREAAKVGEHWGLLELGKVCLVGPKHIRILGMPVIEVPGRDAYLERVAVGKEVWRMREEYDTFLLSCGFLANVLIYQLGQDMPDGVRMWDVGAIWDPWCGVLSRPWHRKVTVKGKPARVDPSPRGKKKAP